MSSSCQLGALWEANSAPGTVSVNWISKAEVRAVAGWYQGSFTVLVSLSFISLPLSGSIWFWMPTQSNGQFAQPIFMCLNPTSYSQLTSEQTLTQRLPRDLHLLSSILTSCCTSLPSVPTLMLPLLRLFFNSFRVFVTTQTPSHLSLKSTCPHKNNSQFAWREKGT